MSQTLLNQSKYNSPKHLVYIHPDSNFGMFTFHTLKIINQCDASVLATKMHVLSQQTKKEIQFVILTYTTLVED